MNPWATPTKAKYIAMPSDMPYSTYQLKGGNLYKHVPIVFFIFFFRGNIVWWIKSIYMITTRLSANSRPSLWGTQPRTFLDINPSRYALKQTFDWTRKALQCSQEIFYTTAIKYQQAVIKSLGGCSFYSTTLDFVFQLNPLDYIHTINNFFIKILMFQITLIDWVL